MRQVVTIALALAAAPACTTLAQVDATVEQVCLSYPNLGVPAPVADASVLPSASPTAAVSSSFVFDDLGPIHDLLSDHVELQFLRAEIHTSSADVLAGIETATVALASDEPATLPRSTIYQCAGDCAGSDTATIELPASRFDYTKALAYMASDSLLVDLAASGSLPDHAWTMDVDVCMSGSIHYDVTP